MLGRVPLPRPEELESHPVPPSLGQNTQWWPDSTPPPRYIYNIYISTYLQYLHKYLYLYPLVRLPPSTVQYSTHHPVYPTQPTPPPKLYALPNCREFLGRRIR